jgi:hypothetical protein
MVTMVGLRRSLRSERTSTLVVTAVVAALAAAVGEELIALSTGGWSWVALAQSAARNGFFALVLVGAVVRVRGQRPSPAPANPARPRCTPAPADQLARELSDMSDVADELGVISEAGRPGDGRDGAFDYLDSVRWSLAGYVLRGDRTRRLVNSPSLLVEVVAFEETDDELVRAARTLRTRADELASQVRYTNTVLAEWLVAHRVAPVNPCYLDSSLLLDRYRHGELDPSAIAEDPLYLLICHLHDVLEAVEDSGDVDDPALDHLQAQLTLPLHAVQREVNAAMAHHAAAIGLTRTVARMQAISPPTRTRNRPFA